jgi:hypothetical protein
MGNIGSDIWKWHQERVIFTPQGAHITGVQAACSYSTRLFVLCFAPLIMRSDEGSLVGEGIFLFNIYFLKIFFEE